jgi:hypothetical protein
MSLMQAYGPTIGAVALVLAAGILAAVAAIVVRP